MKRPNFNPLVGDLVCDCRYKHIRIAERNGDDLVLEDGARCSLKYCCDDPALCTHPDYIVEGPPSEHH